jgi:hypothetical protein
MGCGASKDAVQFDFGDDSPKRTPAAGTAVAVAPTPPTRPAPPNKATHVQIQPKPSETFRPPASTTSFQPPVRVQQQQQTKPVSPVPKAPTAVAPALKTTYIHDDGDFSVAPSLELDCRSVVETSFDDIYTRGREVRYCKFTVFTVVIDGTKTIGGAGSDPGERAASVSFHFLA